MQPVFFTLEEALEFFNYNAGTVLCVDGSRESECSTKEQCREFYANA